MRLCFFLCFVALAACDSPSSSDADAGNGSGDANTIPLTCGNGAMDSGEECDDGNDNRFDGCRNDCTKVDPIAPTANTWQYIEIPGTKCIDGTPSGFAINHNPASTKIVFYLEAGGACFNDLCESLHHPMASNIPTTGGIFDRANTANPVRDWTWVYVPYCSGDVYAGQAETMLGGKLRYFYGYSNITAFLERLVPSFPTTTQVLLTGSSAGGFGSAINYPQTQRAFGSVPVVLIDDSAPPMSTDVYPECLQTIWKNVWRLDLTVLAECGADCPGNTFSEELFAHVRKEFPNMKGGLYSTTGDQTIRSFAGYGWTNGYNMCGNSPGAVSTTVYTNGLNEIRTNVGTTNFATFYIAGTSHTRLRASSFYTTTVGQTSLPEWMADVLAGTITHIGP